MLRLRDFCFNPLLEFIQIDFAERYFSVDSQPTILGARKPPSVLSNQPHSVQFRDRYSYVTQTSFAAIPHREGSESQQTRHGEMSPVEEGKEEFVQP